MSFRSTVISSGPRVTTKRHVVTRPESAAVVGLNTYYSNTSNNSDTEFNSVAQSEAERCIISASGAPLSPKGRTQLKRTENYGPGGPDTVVLGNDNISYDTGIKEAQLRAALDPSLRDSTKYSPIAGSKPLQRERVSTIPVGGPSTIQNLWKYHEQTATESLAEAQMRIAYDPKAREAAENLEVAGKRVEQKWLGNSIRTTRNIGGNETFALTWEGGDKGSTSNGRRSSGVGIKIGEENHDVSAYSRPSTAKPRDSMGGILGNDDNNEGNSSNIKRSFLKPEHPVGGRSAAYLSSDNASMVSGYSPSVRSNQPLGGRGLQVPLDAASPVVGAKTVSKTFVSQIVF